MNEQRTSCTDLMRAAEQELAAFFLAVNESYGPEQAALSAEDWLHGLHTLGDAVDSIRGLRQITIDASSRLARRVNTRGPASSTIPTLGLCVSSISCHP